MPSSIEFRAIIITPFGIGGKGGIDRLMDAVGEEIGRAHTGIQVHVIRARGEYQSWIHGLHVFAGAIVRLLWLRSCNVAHVNVSQDGSVVRKMLIAAVLSTLKVPYVVHVHGSSFDKSYERRGFIYRWCTRRLLQHAERVIVLGTPWHDYLKKRGLGRRIEVLANAVRDVEKSGRNGASHSTTTILFLGRIGARKGTADLLRALQCLPSGTGDWRAVIAGDGEVQEAMQLASQLGVASQVEFPGWVKQDEINGLLETADILVLPSYAENLPMSVIEGMAAGLAIIATPVGAVPDIVQEGRTGLLVPPGDVEALGRALRNLIQEPELRLRLGIAAQNYQRENLSLSRYADRLVKIWKEDGRRLP